MFVVVRQINGPPAKGDNSPYCLPYSAFKRDFRTEKFSCTTSLKWQETRVVNASHHGLYPLQVVARDNPRANHRHTAIRHTL